MPKTNLALIVTSLHARSGKTLLARVLAEHFILAGSKPLIYDTDAIERRLCACFPYDAVVLDIGRVRDQMALFDTLARPFPADRIVDVSHQSSAKFFDLMCDTDFIAETKANQVTPVVLYIVDRDRDSFEEAMRLRECLVDCPFVLVENEFLPRPSAATRQGSAYRALETHQLRISMPALDPALADVIDDAGLSLSALMRQPLSRDNRPRQGGELSFDARADLRAWLIKLLRDVHHMIRAIDRPATLPLPILTEAAV